MLKVILLALFLVLSSCAFSECPIRFSTKGVEFDQSAGVVSETSFGCLKDNAKRFFINQIMNASGVINPDFMKNYNRAKNNYKIEFIDVYATVCNIKTTSNEMCKKIKNALPDPFSGQVWLDISHEENCWTGSHQDRLSFVENVAHECKDMGMKMAIKSDAESWKYAFGEYDATRPAFTKLQLWYADFAKNSPCRSDYAEQPFGGWKITENPDGQIYEKKMKSYSTYMNSNSTYCYAPFTLVAY